MPEVGSHVLVARLVTLGHHHDAAHAAARAPALAELPPSPEHPAPARGKPAPKHPRHG